MKFGLCNLEFPYTVSIHKRYEFGFLVTWPSQRSKQCTLAAQSYNWYGMDAQDVLIVKIPIIRKLYWPLL